MIEPKDILTNEIDLEIFPKEIFQEHNYLRRNPQSYIEKLERVLSFFRGKYFRHPMEMPIETYEGEKGVINAIEFLKQQNPVRELIFSEELSKAARDHAIDIGDNGISNHIGSDNSTLYDRIEKYIEWDGGIGESIQYCYKFPGNIIMSLLISDGSKSKIERENLFNPEFKYVGIDCEKHKKFQVCTVINYAKILFKKNKDPPDRDENRIITKDYVPNDSIGVEIKNNVIKTFSGDEHNFTRKIFDLSNGKKYILDYEE